MLAALVSQLRAGSRSLLIRSLEAFGTQAFSTEVSVDDKPAYAESLSDTRELSRRALEDIVVNLRKQSKNDDQASISISDESDYESDETDQVLAVNEHIVPVAEPYWRAGHEFSTLYDDEDSLWLSAMAGVVASIGEAKLSPPSSPVASVSKPITVPQQWGDASIKFAGTLHSGRAGLKPSCCQLRRSWLVMDLVVRQWNKCLMDRPQ